MTVMDYRTKDGLAEYGFSIEFHSSRSWRVYIIFDPVCKNRNDISEFPYESLDDNGRRYVDWPKLDSLGDAKTVAELWAELAHRHQRAHEERELYLELIRHHRCMQVQKGK
jgi:hypothetical protein